MAKATYKGFDIDVMSSGYRVCTCNDIQGFVWNFFDSIDEAKTFIDGWIEEQAAEYRLEGK